MKKSKQNIQIAEYTSLTKNWENATYQMFKIVLLKL